MNDGGITELNPCSLPAEGGRLFRFYIKGCIFIPPVLSPCICHQYYDAVCFHTFRGQHFAVLFSFVGGLALPLGLSQMVPLPPFAPIGGDQCYPPHPLNPTRPVCKQNRKSDPPLFELAPVSCIQKNFYARTDVIAQNLKNSSELCYTIRGLCFMLTLNYEICPKSRCFSVKKFRNTHL